MASSSSETSIKGAKWPEWNSDRFPPSTIETSLFTHITYAFLNPNRDTFKFKISDQKAKELKAFTSTLHSKKPSVKVLFSIGGHSEGPDAFARMASSESSRQVFINSCIEVARDYNFDGIDFDYEFPRNQGEMDQLGCLFDEWRVKIEENAKSSRRQPLLLSASVYYRPECYDNDQLYPIDSIKKNLDYINLMCYDYYGPWRAEKTGNHATLFNNRDKTLSTSYGIESWIKKGVQQSKLIMGLPLYGRTFRLNDQNHNGIGDLADGIGPGENGYLPYRQIVGFNLERNATVIHDEESTKSTYSYAGSHWIGYDDERSIKKKLEYAKDKRLGGYTLFAIGYDNNWQLSTAASREWDGN